MMQSVWSGFDAKIYVILFINLPSQQGIVCKMNHLFKQGCLRGENDDGSLLA